MIATKISCFAQFGIFAHLSGSRQSQNHLLICLSFSVGKLQTQKIIQSWTLTIGMSIFQASSPCPNRTHVQTLEKIDPIFTQP